MLFTEKLHQLSRPLWLKSIHHPFIKQLVSGTLPLSQFRFYLIQDRYYLNEFSQLENLIADKLHNKKAVNFLKREAQELKNGEIQERKTFFKKLQITPEKIKLTPVSPTVYNYVNHMYACLYRNNIQTAVAALLPCPWLYNEIGKNLAQKSSPISFYAQWLSFYGSADYSSNTQQMIDLTEQVADTADKTKKQEMTQAFIKSSYFELNYWDMALQKESWD